MEKKMKVLFAVMAVALLAAPLMAEVPVPTGVNPATGLPWTAGDQYRLAFISSVKHTAESADIEVYNSWVQDLASAANVGEVDWYVIGSTVDVDARDNTMTNPEDPNDPNCPILLMDATTLVALDKTDLWDGEIQHIINLTEKGEELTHWPFTGTNLDGTVTSGHHGPLGNTGGESSQGNSASTTQWVWRVNTAAPKTEEHYMYAMSEVLTFGSLPSYIYPPYGEVVIPGNVEFLWENLTLEPGDANDIYVEVLFGTDPNETFGDMAPLTLDPVSGLYVTSVTKEILEDGVYYWRVNSDIGGPNVVEGPLYWFEVVSDSPPESVEVGPDMITWSGEGLDLTAIVTGDDGVSALDYVWTYDAPVGVDVSFDYTAGYDVPAVTATKVPYLTPNASNGSFEENILADGASVSCDHVEETVPSWRQTWSAVGSDDWAVAGYKAGATNPTIYATIPDGENVGFVRSDTADNALQQDTSLTIQPNTTYVLSAMAGNPSTDVTGTYRIEIAGATTAASPSSAAPDPCEWTAVSVTYVSGADSTADANVGQQLVIRLVSEGHQLGGQKEMNFDNVVLTIDGQSGSPVYDSSKSVVTINVAVNDQANPTPVTDSMTIDVYENACEAAIDPDGLNRGPDNPTDLDGDCNTDIDDLVIMALKWLNSKAADGPVAK